MFAIQPTDAQLDLTPNDEFKDKPRTYDPDEVRAEGYDEVDEAIFGEMM